MMAYEELLGLTVDLATAKLNRLGFNAPVTVTAPPRGADTSGTLRVVSVRMDSQGPRLIAAHFKDGSPEM